MQDVDFLLLGAFPLFCLSACSHGSELVVLMRLHSICLAEFL